jgi:hypothetical protein
LGTIQSAKSAKITKIAQFLLGIISFCLGLLEVPLREERQEEEEERQENVQFFGRTA